jgi:hypothetical protein
MWNILLNNENNSVHFFIFWLLSSPKANGEVTTRKIRKQYRDITPKEKTK